MILKTNPAFTEKMNSYPDHVRGKMENLRGLVIEAAEEISDLAILE